MQNSAGVKGIKHKTRARNVYIKVCQSKPQNALLYKKGHAVSDFLSDSQAPDHSLILVRNIELAMQESL